MSNRGFFVQFIQKNNKENKIIIRRKKKQIDFFICKIQGISCKLLSDKPKKIK